MNEQGRAVPTIQQRGPFAGEITGQTGGSRLRVRAARRKQSKNF
jgi:hypothetical protein